MGRCRRRSASRSGHLRAGCCPQERGSRRPRLWATNRVAKSDTQYNHVWSDSRDPDLVTALWNICCTPAFLAKTTDSYPRVQSLLRYGSFGYCGYLPAGTATLPARPSIVDLGAHVSCGARPRVGGTDAPHREAQPINWRRVSPPASTPPIRYRAPVLLSLRDRCRSGTALATCQT